MATTYVKPRFRIELKTGDPPPNPEWVPLESQGSRRFKFAEQWQAEEALRELQARQPHATFRVKDI